METKYQIGDIIGDDSLLYLIEDIDYCGYESLCYKLLFLNTGATKPAYIHLTDNSDFIKRLA